jgi:hypothetical protein
LFPELAFSFPTKPQLHHLGAVSLIAQGLLSLFKTNTWRDWLSGVNVMQQHNLPIRSQMLSVFELLQLARKNKVKLAAASTVDIEWNGEELPS